ncbi:MAG: catechol 2,3-dioxygenase-like lactoylglutathione lyase family enzyme [Paracoccaceae bacterium]|jgi:catechol 2,3-dioxygenase-like lactoylglutathione lyase family enzyme
MPAILEHVNLTVTDTDATAVWMCDLFGWHVRWKGDSIHGGQTVHVGSDTDYLALYTPPNSPAKSPESHFTVGGLNHIAIIVDDIAAMKHKVIGAGFTPGNFGDYEPGQRFYFRDHDGIEYEVVQYD